MKIKVLLVDDHLLVLLGIKQLLEHESDLEVVNTICDPAGINAAISKNHPDVVVMDIRMKGYNGIELTKKLIESYPNLKIVILSAYNDDEYIDASYHACLCVHYEGKLCCRTCKCDQTKFFGQQYHS